MKKLIILSVFLIWFTGCQSTDKIEDISCKYVSMIIQDEWDTLVKSNASFRRYISKGKYHPATCAAVKLGKPLKKNYWHNAVAYLHNGKEMRITVEVLSGHVYVEVAENLSWPWE
jgi:hypothetical protein